jgi:hypothetical protein
MSVSCPDLEPAEQLFDNKSVTRIVCTDFPQYFTLVSRVRQQSKTLGPAGGILSSTVVPQVQAVFPEGAINKPIRVGLQVRRRSDRIFVAVSVAYRILKSHSNSF